jgi:hypothetical protein
MLACSCWLYPTAIVIVGVLALGAFFTWRIRRRREGAPTPEG